VWFANSIYNNFNVSNWEVLGSFLGLEPLKFLKYAATIAVDYYSVFCYGTNLFKLKLFGSNR